MSRSLGHLGEIEVEDGGWKEVPDWFLGPFWVDDFCDIQTSDYGSNEFHGRFHPAIPYLAMMRFTKPGDVVWDCFAGSGTTIDVGDELYRNVIASDMHSVRDDILEIDASKWHPGAESVDLGIMHPPYMNIIDYDSPMSDAESVAEFKYLFRCCMSNMDVALKLNHVLVLVVGEVWVDGELHVLEYPLDDEITSFGYRRIGRIAKDFGGETKGGEQTGPRTSNLWKYRLLKYGYFRYGIDTILFYQKRSWDG